MLVTQLGIFKEVRLVHLEKAELPIEITLLGMIVFLHPVINVFEEVSMMALQLSRES
jgi:hypothetical protein